jgi:hypothetical protein
MKPASNEVRLRGQKQKKREEEEEKKKERRRKKVEHCAPLGASN